MGLEQLGQRIKALRAKKGLSQQQVAFSLSLSPQAVSNWERGLSFPDIASLKPLAELLETSLDYLLEMKEQRGLLQSTVLYSSIRHFADKARTLTSKDYADLLNGIHHTLTETVLSFQGVPVKYLGDGFLSYFSGNNSEQRAFNAAKTSLSKLESFPLLMTLHVGEVYVTKIGHQDFSKLDIVGDVVNETFMMNNWANSDTDASLAITQEVLDKLPNTPCNSSHSLSLGERVKTIYLL